MSATAPDNIADWVVTLNKKATCQLPTNAGPRSEGVHSLDEKGRS